MKIKLSINDNILTVNDNLNQKFNLNYLSEEEKTNLLELLKKEIK